MPTKFTGLVAAPHTPFTNDGALNLSVVEKQAAHLLANGVKFAFIGGSTGESHSLTLDERLQLAPRWFEVAKGTDLKVIVHVGSNCLHDSATLANQAQQLGAAAVAALAPSYFKPANVDILIDCCAKIAQAAPQTPFYFYDIPILTGVNLSMPEFLKKAPAKIPNLAGIKFTNSDLMSFQQCLQADNGRYDILWGTDQVLISALAAGAQGAVGSTYNFAAPIYHALIEAFKKNDLQAARAHQMRAIQLIQVLDKRGYMASAKALMQMQGVPVGPPRLPNPSLSPTQIEELRQELAPLNAF